MKRLVAAAITLLFALAPIQGYSQPGSPTTTATPAPNGGITRGFSATKDDLYDTLQIYALHAKISIYIDPSTPHTAQGFQVRNVADKDALGAIIHANGLSSIVVGNTTFIGPPASLAKYNPGAIVSASIPTDADPTMLAQSLGGMLPPGTQVYPQAATTTQNASILVIGSPEAITQARTFLLPGGALQYARFDPNNGSSASDLIGLYKQLYPYVSPNELVLDALRNKILIRGDAGFLKTAAENLQALDTPVPQVFYDVNVIEMTPETYELNRGLLFGGQNATGQQVAGSGSTTITKVSSIPFNVTINALESQGKASILRRPSLVVANSKTGTQQDTTTIPYSVPNSLTGIPTIANVTTGVILTATPTVTGNTIHSVIKESYTAAVGTNSTGIPTTETNAVDTETDSTPDQTYVISGLLADDDSTNVTGLPPLSHLMFIGGLFRNRQSTRQHFEVIVTLQAHIDYPGKQNLPVRFNAIPNALLQNGIDPAPLPTPTAHP